MAPRQRPPPAPRKGSRTVPDLGVVDGGGVDRGHLVVGQVGPVDGLAWEADGDGAERRGACDEMDVVVAEAIACAVGRRERCGGRGRSTLAVAGEVD